MPYHTIPQPQSALSHFSEDLRAKYAKYLLPHHSNPQCRMWMLNVSKKYLHPDIISKEQQKEQPDSDREVILRGQGCRLTKKDSGDPVQLANLFEVKTGKNCECVLVEGGPGMGKSTLAWQVCHRWGRRELFVQYSTVLLFQLRDRRVQDAKQVEDLFFDLSDVKAQKEVKQEIGKGEGVLLILDGLDELPDHLLSELSIFTDILSGAVLGDATILATSRPSATEQLLSRWPQRISKHLIICGFTKEDVDKYIKSLLPGEKLIEFQKHLSIHPHIQTIMYVPLHSVIVMAVYLQDKKLPNTLTELFSSLVKIILLQCVQEHREYNKEEKVSCDVIHRKIPKPIYRHFMDLCKFAYNHVCKQNLIFQAMPEELHNIGFTDSVPDLFSLIIVHTISSISASRSSWQRAMFHI